tara:strand:+ start:1522 stop:1914 length:393 start_codon:yes stop_codon:yes gene_type:complete
VNIYDKNNNLLAIVIKDNSSTKEKDFHTDHSSEFQIASFNLQKDEVIQRHYHEKQERKVFTTNEVIVLQSGKMTLTLYDLNLNKVEDITLEGGDMVALFDGGHEIRIDEQTKFIEVKQGPYDEEKDKTRF